MDIRKTIATAIVTAMVLSITACASNEKPSGNGGETIQTGSNSINNSIPIIQDGEKEPSISEPVKELGIWDIMPEIPVTSESDFDYKFDSDKGGMVVTDYLGSSLQVRVPDTIAGEQVVSVNLYNCKKSLTQLVMPKSAKSFSLSSTIKESLQYINLPDSIIEINKRTFQGCIGLIGIYIGNGVTKIDEYAFEDYTSLTNVYIGNGVTEIGYKAFGGCTGLTSLYIGNNVANIHNYSFAGCIGLTRIIIPDSVTEIGEKAFAGTNITHINIPTNVTNIGESAFVGCANLTSIEVSADNLYYSSNDGILYNKSGKRLEFCPDIKTDVIIPNGVTEIAVRAFIYHSNLTSITIPDSVTVIGEGAFYECKSLTSITIPNSVTTIGLGAFNCCESLENITILNGVTEIDSYAFKNCTSLTSMTIPDSVIKISSHAFEGCTSLASATYKGKTYDYEHIDDLYKAINSD